MEKADLVETKVKNRVKNVCKALGARKSVMNCRTLGMTAKCEGGFVSSVLYGAETREERTEEKRRMNIFEVKCLKDMTV